MGSSCPGVRSRRQYVSTPLLTFQFGSPRILDVERLGMASHSLLSLFTTPRHYADAQAMPADGALGKPRLGTWLTFAHSRWTLLQALAVARKQPVIMISTIQAVPSVMRDSYSEHRFFGTRSSCSGMMNPRQYVSITLYTPL